MNDQASKFVLSKATLLERIQHYRSILEETIHSLSESQLITPDPEGWAIRDHLAHLAVWELGMVELLHKRPRFAAMGVEEAFTQGKSEEEINELILKQHQNLPVPEIIRRFNGTHQRMLQLLDGLDDEDLNKPYSAYVPGGDENRQDPVIYWVIGNTYAHFDEHTVYIHNLLEAG